MQPDPMRWLAGVRVAAHESSICRMKDNAKDDWSAAWAFVGVMIALKVVLGVVIFVYMPLMETASLYTVLHLSAIFGLIPLLALGGGGVWFWLRVARMRLRRRELLRMEWEMEGEEPSVDGIS